MRTYKKLLVTGHLGFIGSNFCHALKDRYEITGIDFAGWGSMQQNLAPGVRDIRGDIADSDFIQTILNDVKPDAIINFAAESHNDRANQDDKPFWMSNLFGARNLGLGASRLSIRMLQVSTDEVYGDAVSSTEPWTEASPMSPRSAYAVTKTSAELLLRTFASSEKYKLDVVFTRGANTIGPRQLPEKAIPKAIRCFVKGEQFPLFPTPARRMWMDVRDHVAGIEAALLHSASNEVYNLAPAPASEAYTKEVIERVHQLVRASVPGTKGEKITTQGTERDNYDLRYWMSAEKAKRILGWEAQYNLDQTLQSTVDWYLDNLDWLEIASNKIADSGPNLT